MEDISAAACRVEDKGLADELIVLTKHVMDFFQGRLLILGTLQHPKHTESKVFERAQMEHGQVGFGAGLCIMTAGQLQRGVGGWVGGEGNPYDTEVGVRAGAHTRGEGGQRQVQEVE